MGPHVRERLSAYMDGELGEPDRAQVDAHLRGCPDCSQYLDELRAVDAAARALPLDVPDGYFEAFPKRVSRRLPARSRRPLYVPVWLGAAAAALILALITPRLLREPRAPAPAPAAQRASDLAAARQTPPPVELAAPPAAESKKDSDVNDAVAPLARDEAPRPAAGTLGLRLERRQSAGPPPSVTPPATVAQPAAPVREHARNAEEAPAADYAAPPPATLEGQTAPAEIAPKASAPGAAMEKVEKEQGAAGRAGEFDERRDKAAFGASQRRADAAKRAPGSAERFQLLLGRTATSAVEARALRDAWRAFARDEGEGSRADEARVRAVEAGADAWRKGKDEKDRAEAQREGREYLARADALQPERVRAALRTLSP